LRRLAARHEETLDQAIHLEGAEDPHGHAERVAELRLMLSVLADEDAEVVELLVARAEGTSVEELGRRTGLSQGALKMRLMRARKRLRLRLETLRRG
jgi:DNA-directed RNA polymerase specialized sigma24 family protein